MKELAGQTVLGTVFQAEGSACAKAPRWEEPDEQEVREAGSCEGRSRENERELAGR